MVVIFSVFSVRRMRPAPLPATIEIVYLFCALSSCSMSPVFLLQVLDVVYGNMYHVQLPYKSHPFLHAHVQRIHKTFKHPGFDTQFVNRSKIKI